MIDPADFLKWLTVFKVPYGPASISVSSGEGTANQILVNGTFGTPETGALVFNLPLLDTGYVIADGTANRYSMSYQSRVLAASTSNIPCTYNNGVAGVGATITATAFGALVLDGVTLVLGDRVVIGNQTASEQNGIYDITILGDGSTHAVLTRSNNFDTPAKINAGNLFYVTHGTIWIKRTLVQQFNITTIGSDAISFDIAAWSSQTVITINTLVAGAGIDIQQVMGNTVISASGGGLGFATIGTSQTLSNNTHYICTSGGALSLALPAVSIPGNVIQITLDGSTSFTITQPNAASQIRNQTLQTTLGTGGTLSSTATGNSVTLTCETANARWIVTTQQGNLTAV